jgi:hypothetical protein
MIYLVSFFSEQQCGHWNSYCSGTTACAWPLYRGGIDVRS